MLTSWVIFVATWTMWFIVCHAPNVHRLGETGCRLADHFREHRRDVSNGRNHLPVPAHFNQANYTQDDMKAGVLNAGLANQEYSKKQEISLNFFNGTMGLSGLNQDSFFFMWITHLLLTRAQASTVTQRGKRVGNDASTPLFKWCVMQSRNGTSALSVLLVRSMVGEIFLSFANQFDPRLLHHTFSNVHCQWTFGAWPTINHVIHDAGKKSRDVNMPFGCCNRGWWIAIGTSAANVWAN